MDLVIVFLVSAAVTALSGPLTIKIAKAFNLVDNPAKRPHPAHIQDRVIPRAGGLMIYIGILTTCLLFLNLDKALTGILLGITILLIMGLIDDKLDRFNPYIRLVILFIAALCAVGAGIGVSFITNPFYQLPNPLFDFQNPAIRLDTLVVYFNFEGVHKIFWLADLFALIWIVTLTQVINWSKGVDGQMPGITLIASLVLGLFSLKLFLNGDPNQLNVAKLAFITAGASLSFLIFNWHPSKIIPGFSASTILAFMLAVLAILSGAKIAVAILVLAIPVLDFIFTILRRLWSGKSPVWGDRKHLHHRLLDLGWSHQKISLFYILGSVILGAAALFLESLGKLVTIGAVGILFILIIIWLNYFGEFSKPPGPDNGSKI